MKRKYNYTKIARFTQILHQNFVDNGAMFKFYAYCALDLLTQQSISAHLCHYLVINHPAIIYFTYLFKKSLSGIET